MTGFPATVQGDGDDCGYVSVFVFAISDIPCASVSKRVLVKNLSFEMNLIWVGGTHFNTNGFEHGHVSRQRQKTAWKWSRISKHFENQSERITELTIWWIVRDYKTISCHGKSTRDSENPEITHDHPFMAGRFFKYYEVLLNTPEKGLWVDKRVYVGFLKDHFTRSLKVIYRLVVRLIPSCYQLLLLP